MQAVTRGPGLALAFQSPDRRRIGLINDEELFRAGLLPDAPVVQARELHAGPNHGLVPLVGGTNARCIHEDQRPGGGANLVTGAVL